MASDAVPAGLAKRTPGARAAPGLRPPALRPAARSSLMVSATHRKMDQPPKARPGAVKDTAMERRGAHVSSDRGHSAPQGAKSKERLAALHPSGVSGGRKGETA